MGSEAISRHVVECIHEGWTWAVSCKVSFLNNEQKRLYGGQVAGFSKDKAEGQVAQRGKTEFSIQAKIF